jgi:hypothetical protein
MSATQIKVSLSFFPCMLKSLSSVKTEIHKNSNLKRKKALLAASVQVCCRIAREGETQTTGQNLLSSMQLIGLWV